MGFYTTDETRHSLLNYRYHGEDRSLLYKHVLNPMAVRLVEFIPVWLAPNVISVIGLSLLFIASAVTYLHCPGFNTALPDSVSKLCALSIFLYQTLDNLDGKQARRIGNSTPLGLLIDHGVDALAVTISTTIMGAVFQTGTGLPLLLLWLTGMIPFTFATWEEYYTGSLVLGILNGPSDGLAIAVLCCLLPVFFGADFWAAPISTQGTFPPDWAWIANLPRNRIIFAMLIVGLIPTIAMNVNNVIRSRLANSKSILAPLKTLGPFLTLVSSSYVWFRYSPSKVLETNPRWCLFTIGFVFGNIACNILFSYVAHSGFILFPRCSLLAAAYALARCLYILFLSMLEFHLGKLMLAHVGNHKYRVKRYSLIPVVLAAINTLLGAPINEVSMAIATLATALACWLHFVIIAGWEVTSILGIRVFVVKSPTKSC